MIKDMKLYFGDALLGLNEPEVTFEMVSNTEETFFKIENYDQMPPFLMTIVSDVDFWLFISSTGGLTAGRKSPENSLFPYYTDDKIHDGNETTGSYTSLIVNYDDKLYLWKPFTLHNKNVYKITRNLYKNVIGNKIIFEEINYSLKMRFRYTWKTSNGFGFVKESEIINESDTIRRVEILDGIRNILPYGVDALSQTMRSTLVDGYKRNELLPEYGLGIFTLSSIISDKAEPSESLKATTVWSKGLFNPKYLLSDQQVGKFETLNTIESEVDVKGRRGSYYVSNRIELAANGTKKWVIVSEINQSAAKVEGLIQQIKSGDAIIDDLNQDVLRGDINLNKLVFNADGLQMTQKEKNSYRHFSNTLYNIMRGGIYADAYNIKTNDLKKFVAKWNKKTYEKYRNFFENISETVNYFELLKSVEAKKDMALERLISEYLPLTYSRRHGDPSRPWNKFSIEVTEENGDQKLNFEGNWRDIFQNWEALSFSYPGYINSIILKFVNASTPDGYNPYRITKDGIDWEKPDPADPWSNIGYWGDHQVIYLLKLMELSKAFRPDELTAMFYKNTFVYANVPYRIKSLESLIKDSKNTIIYDEETSASIEETVSKIGSDGKLVFVNNEIYHVNLMEKMLVILLSKLSNFIPEAGIWMNTQRPEWNDANNALVGNGVSMVTLYYLHRYLVFLSNLVEEIHEDIKISSEVMAQFEGLFDIFKAYLTHLDSNFSDQVRFEMVTKLGKCGERYRQSIYTDGFSGKKESLRKEDLKKFVQISLLYLKDTIDKNKREDDLYHSYNLIKFGKNVCTVSPLYEMLEGQVAVISSKALSSRESVAVLKALRRSPLYRADQNSYMLYPDRDLKRFMDKNRIPKDAVDSSHILKNEIKNGLSRFIEKDVNGNYHFNGRFRNSSEIMEAIYKTNEYTSQDIEKVGEIYADLFDHHSFTGRSGTFYKYEGLGSIYWHMVSKLLLAVGESYKDAVKDGDDEVLTTLSEYYHDIKSGIGAEKSPVKYGAFPTDAYSHTPSFSGAQQPGMTGQVKEDIISRFEELGVCVTNGEICFRPRLLLKDEFLKEKTEWNLPSGQIVLEANQLGFTIGSIPIVYELSRYNSITICYENGDKYTFENCYKLNQQISQSIFDRDGKIKQVHVHVNY